MTLSESKKEVFNRIGEMFDVEYNKCLSVHRQYDVEKARAMVWAWLSRYGPDFDSRRVIVRGVEMPFTLPILSTFDGHDTGSTYSGIIDWLLEIDGKLYPSDHKTKTSPPNDTYWCELKTVNQQITHYMLGLQQSGIEVSGFLWDMMTKPGIEPKELTRKAKAELEHGSYCGFEFHDSTGDEKRETPKMYGARAKRWYIDNTEKVFHRQIIQRTPDQLLQYMAELGSHALAQHALKTASHPPVRNLNSCSQYNEMCAYTSLCVNTFDMNYDTDLFEVAVNPVSDRHTGAASLSPSRIKCMSECSRKAWYKYVLNLKSKSKSYVPQFEVGGMFHAGLEIFLKSRLEEPIVLDNP